MTDPVAAERVQLLTEGARLDPKRNDADWLRYEELWDRYRELLPEVTVARCPHSGDLVRWPIDTYGLDGWFWRYLGSARRAPDRVPSSWLTMAGAMRIRGRPEKAPFVAMPGPEVPYVVPGLLGTPGVRAVIAEVTVGAHTGWAISYFGPRAGITGMANLWGTDTYPIYGAGRATWGSAMPWIREYDFDLTGWLRSGALLWIEPGDTTATLREGADGCPFVNLRGRRKLVVTFNGKKWYALAFAGPAGENDP